MFNITRFIHNSCSYQPYFLLMFGIAGRAQINHAR